MLPEDWSADKCPPCEAGQTFSTSGNIPCNACAAAATCTAGVKAACTTKTDTACNVPCVAGKTFSASGNIPCTTCAVASTCTLGVKTTCTTTKNTVCKVSLFVLRVHKYHASNRIFDIDNFVLNY